MSGAPLLHFSEDPSIERFEPHVPATNPSQAPGVWAIDAEHAPVYWFPRNCPRGSVWADTQEQQAMLSERFQTAARRVQVAELDWLERIRSAKLFVYELDPAPFAPLGPTLKASGWHASRWCHSWSGPSATSLRSMPIPVSSCGSSRTCSSSGMRSLDQGCRSRACASDTHAITRTPASPRPPRGGATSPLAGARAPATRPRQPAGCPP